MRGIRRVPLYCLLAFSLLLPTLLLGQSATDNVLTNADVSKMVKAGISENIILREIQMSKTAFGTSPAALIQLKKQGASERVLEAILDSRMGTSAPSAGQFATPQVFVPTVPSSGPLRLPNFEADMRFNAKTRGKLSVKQNQIKVERSGVPLFSLKWKENKPQ